jgi:hypothetical protein
MDKSVFYEILNLLSEATIIRNYYHERPTKIALKVKEKYPHLIDSYWKNIHLTFNGCRTSKEFEAKLDIKYRRFLNTFSKTQKSHFLKKSLIEIDRTINAITINPNNRLIKFQRKDIVIDNDIHSVFDQYERDQYTINEENRLLSEFIEVQYKFLTTIKDFIENKKEKNIPSIDTFEKLIPNKETRKIILNALIQTKHCDHDGKWIYKKRDRKIKLANLLMIELKDKGYYKDIEYQDSCEISKNSFKISFGLKTAENAMQEDYSEHFNNIPSVK